MAMTWSLKIGEVKGTGVYVHATFALLLIWAGLSAWSEQHSLVAVADRSLLLFAVFAIVVLHELGHALAGRRYGVKTRDITLLPIGGVARMDRIPRVPSQELMIALAGPAVNLFFAAALMAGLILTGSFRPVDEHTILKGSFAERLMLINFSLLVFNLVPAFPMDGGRVLRALLATRMTYVRATQVAATTGQAIAWFFAAVGLAANPMLVLIALFVWMSAEAESQMVSKTAALAGVSARQAMMTEFGTLEPGDPLRLATAVVLSGPQRDLPVLTAGRMVGLLNRERLLEALRKTPAASVGDIMDRGFHTAEPNEMLSDLLAKLYVPGCRAIPIAEDGRFLGMLTAESLEAFLLFREATQSRTADDAANINSVASARPGPVGGQ